MAVAIFAVPAAATEGQDPDKAEQFSGGSDLGSPSRLDYVKAAIGITPRQSELWFAYAASLRAYREAQRNEREEEVERVLGDAQAIAMSDGLPAREQRVAAKAALKASFEALYAALDSPQRTIADKTLTAGECGR